MNWPLIQSTLLAWLAAASGLKSIVVNEPRPYVPTGRFLTLALASCDGHGVDERRYADNPDPEAAPGQEILETVCGIRHLTFTVAVESISQKVENTAKVFLEKLRSRARMSSSLAAFRSVGLAFIEVTPTANQDREEEERMISVASFDIRFAVAVNETDEDVPLGHIASAELTSHLSRETGAQLPAALQLTGEILP